MVRNDNKDLRFIEAGFPCHQVGAETQRERDTGRAPPVNRLHVWWARRPLTPSRAAILGSLLPADTDPDWFLRQLGIEKVQALVNGEQWTLVEDRLLKRIKRDSNGCEYIFVDGVVLRAFQREKERCESNLKKIEELKKKDPTLTYDLVLNRWEKENQPFQGALPVEGEKVFVVRNPGDPFWAKERIAWENERGIRTKDNKYGYSRAFNLAQCKLNSSSDMFTVLDPTAGGGSIPFEALRLGNKVIANELNPVAAVILYATLDYPLRFGPKLSKDIESWGSRLRATMVKQVKELFPTSSLVEMELTKLKEHLSGYPDLIPYFIEETLDGFLFVRQVTCPHCGGEAPLLNTCWLSKTGVKWGVQMIPDGRKKGGRVHFETYRVKGSRGSRGEDPNFATVTRGVGSCVHCRQAISSDEIKAQARGESPHGRWQDRLYCVVAVRYQPKLDREGKPQRYVSGKRTGEIKTEKVRFFRPPNEGDLRALAESQRLLQERWPEWEQQGLIPTESIPQGHKTMEPLRVGMNRWCDMFTPRQLLGHLTLVEELNRLKPQILEELGQERGRAVVTYLQFMIDKGVDYNSRQTRWEYTRGIVKGNFGRHDFSVKWTFGEMIFSGPNSGAAWALSQVVDAYNGLVELLAPLHRQLKGKELPLRILYGTAAHMDVPDGSVDLICIDPPYYNNVQYAELSDYFYVWQRRTLKDLYPDIFRRRLTNKDDEAVANPARDGSAAEAAREYRRLMGEIFTECRRVLKDEGIMTIMFTHKTLEAWEALTRSLIENGWAITSSMPVESEAAASLHQKDMAAAASSIFLTCRKREAAHSTPAIWSGFGGGGVAGKVREAVRQGLQELAALQLNPVDEMVAGYGRALYVLSENWPVLDGDVEVTPIQAMTEASAVVAQHQIERITKGRLKVENLEPEAAMAVTLYGIFGLNSFPFDQALNLSRSLSIKLEERPAGYDLNGRTIGINAERPGRSAPRGKPEEDGFYAPLLRYRSKLRLALPEERNSNRLEKPQTEWDLLQGLIMAYREGDVPVARVYLERYAAGKQGVILDLLSVWTGEMSRDELRREGEALLFGLQ